MHCGALCFLSPVCGLRVEVSVLEVPEGKEFFKELGVLCGGHGPAAALCPGPACSLKAETQVNLQESPFKGGDVILPLGIPNLTSDTDHPPETLVREKRRTLLWGVFRLLRRHRPALRSPILERERQSCFQEIQQGMWDAHINDGQGS